MNELDLAWAAGFIDGEGNFGIIFGNKGSHFATLSVNNTNIVALEKLQSIFDGSIFKQPIRNVVWRLQSKKAAEVAELLLPYLVIKQEQAALIIQFQSTVGSRSQGRKSLPIEIFRSREEMKQQMHVLNRRGV